MESCYTIGESFTAAPTNAYFQLHNHNDYEILFFLEGDAKYVVEGVLPNSQETEDAVFQLLITGLSGYIKPQKKK